MKTLLALLAAFLTLPLQAQSDLEFIWNKDGFGGLFAKGPQIAYSPDGTRLVVGDVEGTIRILSMPDGEILHEVEYQDRYVDDIDFAPDGKYIAVLLEAKIGSSTILLIDPLSGREVHKLEVSRTPPAFSLRYSSDSQLLVLGASAYVKLLSIPDLNEVWRFDYQSTTDSFIKQADISFNNELLAIGLTDQLMIVERETKKGRVLHQDGSVQDLQFIPGTEELLTAWSADRDGEPNFARFDTRSGERLEVLRSRPNPVPRVLEVSSSVLAVLFTDDNSIFHVLDLISKEYLLMFPESGASQIALSPDSKYIALGRGRGQLSLIHSPWNRVNTDVKDPNLHNWDFSVTPNPASGEVRITFRVPAEGAPVKLSLFNLRGQILHTFIDSFVAGGEQTLAISREELFAMGTDAALLCRLTSETVTLNQQIILH